MCVNVKFEKIESAFVVILHPTKSKLFSQEARCLSIVSWIKRSGFILIIFNTTANQQ